MGARWSSLRSDGGSFGFLCFLAMELLKDGLLMRLRFTVGRVFSWFCFYFVGSRACDRVVFRRSPAGLARLIGVFACGVHEGVGRRWFLVLWTCVGRPMSWLVAMPAAGDPMWFSWYGLARV